MKKTNFDKYLEGQLQYPVFTAKFKRAGEVWDAVLQIAVLRQRKCSCLFFSGNKIFRSSIQGCSCEDLCWVEL
ncbi:MAG: hypothetical protein ACUZ8O_08390 [Candidatus Anammoxibacter sp.]